MNPFEEFRKTLEEVNKIHEQGEEKRQKFHEEIGRIRGIYQNSGQEIEETLSMSEEERLKREQERNNQKKGGRMETALTEEQLQERMKTELTEEEQQEYIRLRNIEAMGKGMGKELPENQKQRLEEIEIKLRGNDSNDAEIEDTNGGEVLPENNGDAEEYSLIGDIKEIQGKPVFIEKKGNKFRYTEKSDIPIQTDPTGKID